MSNWTNVKQQEFPPVAGFYFVTLEDGSTGGRYTRPAYFRFEAAWEDFKRPDIKEWKIEGIQWGDKVVAWQPMELPNPLMPELGKYGKLPPTNVEPARQTTGD